MHIDPVILFFILGALAGLLKSDLRIPRSFYETLSIYLLLAIGIKGGIELSHVSFKQILLPGIAAMCTGMGIAVVALLLLHKVLGFSRADAHAIGAHYGSVSAVTFAVVVTYCKQLRLTYEPYLTVLLVMMEIPGIAIMILLYKYQSKNNSSLKKVVHEVLFGKSILLVIGGLAIGYLTAIMHDTQLNFFFFDLFKGFLAIFMLEMGVVASERMKDLKKVGLKLIAFGVIMPMLGAGIGLLVSLALGFSAGGALIFCTLCASASYIAAPAAVKMAIPDANTSLSLTTALAVTLPFNLLVGITIYHKIVMAVIVS